MSSFTSHLHQISSDDHAPSSTSGSRHDIGPTPVEAAALFRLVQDQMAILMTDANTEKGNDLWVSEL